MDKTKFTKFLKDVQNGMSKHSPEILTGIGIAGMITTTILAVKATPKALELIEEKKREKIHENEADVDDKLSAVETVKAAWKPYVPAVLTCAASTACLVGANTVNMKRITALSTAYKLSETALAEYKEKVIETVGAKKEKVIREKVAEEKVKQNPIANTGIIVTGKGTTRFLDYHSGRRFESDVNAIEKAENVLNRKLTNDMYVSLNEFYDILDLDHTKMGYEMGWGVDVGYIEFEKHAIIDEDGQPCIVLEYNVAPYYHYDKLAR